MTSIHRTAYPHFTLGQKINTRELGSYYSLTEDEIAYIKKNIRGDDLRLGFSVLLKVFQQLGYFPELNIIPQNIILHLKKQLSFIKKEAAFYYEHESALNRHRLAIYQYLNITPWIEQSNKSSILSNHPSKHYAVKIAHKAAQTMNQPADIINHVIEELRKNNYELPAFNQLDKLVKHTKTLVNMKIFTEVYKQLDVKQISMLDDLLKKRPDYSRTGYNDIKQLPKKPTISNFKELLKHHDWLMSLGNLELHMTDISKVKLQQFAEQARSLDASNINDFVPAKRYSLMIFLIHQSQCRAKDSLAITFCKTMAKMHKKAIEKLDAMQDNASQKTLDLLNVFSDILVDCKEQKPDLPLLHEILHKIDGNGGAAALHADCEVAKACNSKNYLPLLWEFYENKRKTLFRLLRALNIQSTTQNDCLIKAMNIILEHEAERSEFLPLDLDLSFTTRSWRKLIIKREKKQTLISRRHLEICIFSHLASDLDSIDLFIEGAESFADSRKELLDWGACQLMLDGHCKNVNIQNNAKAFVSTLRANLIKAAKVVDEKYPEIDEFIIDSKGNPILKKRSAKKRPPSAIWLTNEIRKRMPDRNIIDILCSTHHYTGWANAFGPISGSDPKIDNAIERYIFTNFAYGTCMGPEQAAQHIQSDMTGHMLSWINQRHITAKMLDSAREYLINCINTFPLVLAWGDGKSCAADGNLRELREQNLITEFHMRYSRKGGIAYHHVANNYIALFSTFIPCGVWEAIAIIEGLLKNNSDVQPKIIHADTQGQSTIVFAMAYLLGFKLMPRIRNWKDLKFFRPDKKEKYENIDVLFDDVIKWDLIEKHWQDMMQVVLSISSGKISSSLLLRKLGSYNRKNKLYLAFQELGRVIRTQFLLEYISDVELRETITAETNKAEAYNGLSEWASFGSMVLVASNDDIQMEKAIKYNSILTNSIILQNVVDETNILGQLVDEGHIIRKDDAAFSSPYLTKHIKRYGDYVMNMDNVPKSLGNTQSFVLW